MRTKLIFKVHEQNCRRKHKTDRQTDVQFNHTRLHTADETKAYYEAADHSRNADFYSAKALTDHCKNRAHETKERPDRRAISSRADRPSVTVRIICVHMYCLLHFRSLVSL